MRRRLALYGIALLILGCGQQPPPVQDSGSEPEPELEWDAEQRDVLSGVDFPVFAPEGLKVELTGWGGGDGDPVSSLTLSHDVDDSRRVEVDSEIDAHEVEDEAAQSLRDRDVQAEVVTATRSLLVDGVERPFEFASAGEEWVAIGRVGDVTITVEGNGVDPEAVRLRALVDPEEIIGGTPRYRPHRPAYDVLDPRRVAELADATPIEAAGPKLAGAAQPAIALLATTSKGPSWIGGEPQLPADTRWPEGEHGAMLFVAQLSLADLPAAVWTGPRTGHLHVFCDVNPEDGSIEDGGGCKVLHSPAGAQLHVRRFPSENNRLPRQMVEPSAGLTVPDPWQALSDRLGLGLDTDANYDALWALKERLAIEQGWNAVAGQLLGWGTWQNDDNMQYLAELGGGKAEDWSLLLQTDALDAELYVALPTADLAAGRFDRVEATVEYD